MMTSIEKIKFIESYTQAPISARYILRRLSGEWILEHYSKKAETVTEQTDLGSSVIFPEEFHALLLKCRTLIPATATLWVEEPILIGGRNKEFNELYNEFLQKDEEESKEHYDFIERQYEMDRLFPAE